MSESKEVIPEAAVEAAHERVQFHLDLPDFPDDEVQDTLRLALEAAAPHMLVGSAEFGVFRKNGDEHDAPMSNFTYTTRDRAENAMRQYAGWGEWLEVRGRVATKWAVAK